MSIFRCFIGDHNVDSDYHEIHMIDGVDVCDDCYINKVSKAKE